MLYPKMNNIIYNKTFQYHTTDLIGPNLTTGVNYFNDKWKLHSHNNISVTATGGYSSIENIVNPLQQCDVVLFHVYGIVNKDITNSISFYHISETMSTNDPTIILPANIYSNIDYIDYVFLQTNNNKNYNQYRIFFTPCDNDYNIITTATYDLNLYVDTYCL